MRLILHILTIFCYILKVSFSQTNSQKICIPSSKQLIYYNCVIDYLDCSDGHLEMTTCTQTNCIQINQNGDCLKHNTQTLGPTQCLRKCCIKGNNPPFTAQVLNACQKVNSQLARLEKKNNTLVIALCVAIPIFILFVYISYRCLRCRKQNNVIKTQRQTQKASSNIQNERESIAWSCISAMQDFDNKQMCTICFFTNTNSFTSCGHKFHIQCLNEWLCRSQKCPNCNNQNYNPIQIMCQQCKVRGAKSTITKTYLNPKVQQLSCVQQNKITCDKCWSHVTTQSIESIGSSNAILKSNRYN